MTAAFVRHATPLALALVAFCTTAAAQQARAPRPEGRPMRTAPADPRLDPLLVEWHDATKGITKLEGKHRRWVYDSVFGVEQRSEGAYYYEAPDKGRIDIEVHNKALLSPPAQKQLPNGEPYTVKLDQAEKWICDGTSIFKIYDEVKEYERLTIPPQNRGANIMDGPLPFLFGMPPAKAKARYDMRILNDSPQRVMLEVRPRLAKDRANWSAARVILAKPEYLPDAIRILDPAGNKETTYQFVERTVNPGRGWWPKFFNKKPFEPALDGYKLVQNDVAVAAVPGKPAAGAIRPAGGQAIANTAVPSVVGLAWNQAKDILAARGYVTKVEKGPVAARPELVYHVESQNPEPGASLAKGETVTVFAYTKP